MNSIILPTEITGTEKETALFLLKDLTVKEVKEIKIQSFDAIQSQTKRIRTKMYANTIYAALGRMIALDIITKEELVACLPTDWDNVRNNRW